MLFYFCDRYLLQQGCLCGIKSHYYARISIDIHQVNETLPCITSSLNATVWRSQPSNYFFTASIEIMLGKFEINKLMLTTSMYHTLVQFQPKHLFHPTSMWYSYFVVAGCIGRNCDPCAGSEHEMSETSFPYVLLASCYKKVTRDNATEKQKSTKYKHEYMFKSYVSRRKIIRKWY